MIQKFTFKKLVNEALFHPAGKTFDLDKEMKQVAEIWGSLITLFGETRYIEENMEEAFTYRLEAIDEQNNSIYFEIYHGATGLAIGIGKEYKDSNLNEEMVQAFMDMLQDTKPTDFDYVGYYWDYGCKVELGVVDGEGYARYIELDE